MLTDELPQGRSTLDEALHEVRKPPRARPRTPSSGTHGVFTCQLHATISQTTTQVVYWYG